MDDRSTTIELCGREATLVMTTRATKEIAAKYGGIEKIGEQLASGTDAVSKFDDIVFLILTLANQGVEQHNYKHPEDKQPPFTAEEIELFTDPLEISELAPVLMEVMSKGLKRNIVSEENEKKAVEVG